MSNKNTSTNPHQKNPEYRVQVDHPDYLMTLEKPGRYVVELVKRGASAKIYGVFDARQKDRIKTEVVVHHRAPRTEAHTLLKGVVRDAAHLSFVGRIIIDPECGQTNSFLTERILLLSDTATAEAVPDLEIESDDVKCSHAASISSIPEEQLFYLMSRGVPRAEAQELIVAGFLKIQD